MFRKLQTLLNAYIGSLSLQQHLKQLFIVVKVLEWLFRKCILLKFSGYSENTLRSLISSKKVMKAVKSFLKLWNYSQSSDQLNSCSVLRPLIQLTGISSFHSFFCPLTIDRPQLRKQSWAVLDRWWFIGIEFTPLRTRKRFVIHETDKDVSAASFSITVIRHIYVSHYGPTMGKHVYVWHCDSPRWPLAQILIFLGADREKEEAEFVQCYASEAFNLFLTGQVFVIRASLANWWRMRKVNSGTIKGGTHVACISRRPTSISGSVTRHGFILWQLWRPGWTQSAAGGGARQLSIFIHIVPKTRDSYYQRRNLMDRN